MLRLLEQKRLSVATAESMTGGLVVQRLTQVPGASVWVRGGVVAYDNRVKTEALGVPAALIEEHGAVSAAPQGGYRNDHDPAADRRYGA